MKKLARYFFEGLVFLVPVVATVYVIYIVFVKVDSIFDFQTPGVGVLATLLLITIIGFVASNFITKRFLGIVDTFFRRVPLVKMIYTSIKDLINAFVGDRRRFNKPVHVTILAGSNVKVLGFITAESLDHLGIPGSVAVYLPQSYNFAGNVIIVPKGQVTAIDAHSGDVMAFIVSGGVAKSRHNDEKHSDEKKEK
jgi:uncharacterized membrane protein